MSGSPSGMLRSVRIVAGVDLGATNIRCGVVSRDGEVLAWRLLATPDGANADQLAAAVSALVREAVADGELSFVGVAVATYVSADRSTAMFSPNLPFRRFPFRATLQHELGLPVTIENDANAAIWAEARFGAAQGASDILGLTLGTGVGGAVILGGELRRGANGFGGELGHLRVVPDGELCGCGLRGCLEQYASGTALARYARELGDPQIRTGVEVSGAARAGHEGALEIYRAFGTHLGVALAGLTNALDPEVIVISGGLAAEAELFLDTTREVFAEHVTGSAYRTLPPVVAGALGADAGWRGAADLAAAQLR